MQILRRRINILGSIVGILRLLNPMGTWPVCSEWVNMALHGDFTEKNSKEDVPRVRLYVSLSPGLAQEPTWYRVICSDLISLLCCFHYAGLLVKQSLSYLSSLNVLVVKKRERFCFFAVWSDTNDQWTACPEEKNWLSLWACARDSFMFMNCFEESYTVPCSWTYQAVVSWHPSCLLLQVLLRLAIFTLAVICLNIANGSGYA